MNTGTFLALCATVLTATVASSTARADDKAACLDAAQQAQSLRDAHKLVEAQQQLRACARQQCPAVVQRDCVTWLGEVDRMLPTVVVTAKDEAGSDLADVKVTMDGAPLLDKLDGTAVPVNPGMHAFHFVGSDGATLDRQVLVREGQKDQSVAVLLKKAAEPPMPPPPPPPPPAPAPSPPPAAAPLPTPAPQTTEQVAGGRTSAWRTVGWGVAGVGVAGLAVGAVAGLVAISDKNNASCAPQSSSGTPGYCSGSLSGARSAAKVSDVGFIGGGVLVAGGLALVLAAPRSHEAGASVKLAPTVGANGGGVVLGGSW